MTMIYDDDICDDICDDDDDDALCNVLINIQIYCVCLHLYVCTVYSHSDSIRLKNHGCLCPR